MYAGGRGGGGGGGGSKGIEEDKKLDRSQTRVVLVRSFRMAGEFRKQAILALGLVIITVLCTLAGPVLVRHGIDAGIRKGDREALDRTVIAYIVVVVIAYVVGRWQYVALNSAGEGFLRLIRIRVFSRMQKQSMAFFDREKAGVLVARMTADIESMAELVQWGLMQFLSSFLLLFFAFFLLMSLSWQLTLISLLVFPFLILATIKFQRDANKAYLEVRDKVGANLSALQEGITGVRVIQAYAREDEQIRRFEESNRALYRSHIHSVKVSTWYFGLIEFAGIASSALIVGVGGLLVPLAARLNAAEIPQRLDLPLLLVVGYTDSVGDEDFNQELSEKRASRVLAHLQQVCRWKQFRTLTPSGMAESDPVADNSTDEGKAQNRRVAVNVLVSKAVDGL